MEACVIEYGLMTCLNLDSLPISNTVVWASSMLMATDHEDDPAWALGQRHLQSREDTYTPNEPRPLPHVQSKFRWAGNLTGGCMVLQRDCRSRYPAGMCRFDSLSRLSIDMTREKRTNAVAACSLQGLSSP